MKHFGVFLLMISAVFSGAGCTGTIFNKFSIDEAPTPSVSIDARQRLVIVNEKGGPPYDEDGRPLQQHRVVCAEPSPDAFMALAASGRAQFTAGKQGGEIGGALAETAAAIAPRTQTIQLLRDGLYRACEAYMNGVIDRGEYRRILVSYDELLVTLVALENLGRPTAPPLPKIGGHAAVAADKSTSAATDEASKGSENTPQSQAVPEAAQKMHEIVRDYYCFQLGLKQIFYPEIAKNLSKEVLKTLCPNGGSN